MSDEAEVADGAEWLFTDEIAQRALALHTMALDFDKVPEGAKEYVRTMMQRIALSFKIEEKEGRLIPSKIKEVTKP